MLRKRSVDTITENCMFVVTTFLFSTVFKRGLRVLQVGQFPGKHSEEKNETLRTGCRVNAWFSCSQ